MPSYKVHLSSIDRTDDSNDIEFTTFVEADNNDDAVQKAKAVQKVERPGISVVDTWYWSAYETAEKI